VQIRFTDAGATYRLSILEVKAMKHVAGKTRGMRTGFAWLAGMLLVCIALPAWAAPYAYICNLVDNTVSVIDVATRAVTATIAVGSGPFGVAVTPDGSKVYVSNSNDETVSVIDVATSAVTATIAVGSVPDGVAVTPDGSKVYVANYDGNAVSVIATATNTVTATIPVGNSPMGLAVTPDGSKVYVANDDGNTVSVIAAATNTVTATIPVGSAPEGVAVTPDGSKVYVANNDDNTVSVIATATNTVTATIVVGVNPSGLVVKADGSTVYVANSLDHTVSVIATATNAVAATIAVGNEPQGVAVTADGSKVYVTNFEDKTVSAIATVTNTVVATVPVGREPFSLGQFIGKGPQAISYTSTAPTSATVGGATYTPAAAAASGLSVTLAIDSSASAVCTINGGVVSFIGTGTCVIDANQAGNTSYGAAKQVQQSFTVGAGTPLVAPAIALVFNPTQVAVGGTTTLAVGIANPNSVPLQLNTPDVTITGLPGGATLVVPGSNPTIACSDGTGASDPPIVIPANNGTCTLTFTNVSAGTTAGSYPATWPSNVQFVDANDATNSVNTTMQEQATLTVGATATSLTAPTIALGFNPASVAVNGTTTLTATIANPNSDPVQLNSSISITGLPGNAMLPAPSTIACSDGTGASDPPIVIPANNGTCTLTFTNVSAGTTAGGYTATWGPDVQFVDNNNENIAVNTVTAATAMLTVGTTPSSLTAPTITLAFNPASVAIGGTTTLTATIANPNADPVQLNSSISITGLPSGVTLSGTSSIACSDGSGASDPPIVISSNNGTCTLTFTNVGAGTTAANYTATWGPGVQFVDNNDENISVNTTTAAMATLTVRNAQTGGGTGGVAPAPALSAWMLMLLGMLFAGIGAAWRRARG
jgi:YVTN family beta-propeller protein